jgi:hypothetical protein
MVPLPKCFFHIAWSVLAICVRRHPRALRPESTLTKSASWELSQRNDPWTTTWDQPCVPDIPSQLSIRGSLWIRYGAEVLGCEDHGKLVVPYPGRADAAGVS